MTRVWNAIIDLPVPWGGEWGAAQDVILLEMGQNSKQHRVTAEEGPRGRNVLLLTCMPQELLSILPHFKSDDVAMSLDYIRHITIRLLRNQGEQRDKAL